MSEQLKLLPCPNPKCGSTDVHYGNEIYMGITVVAFCKKCHMRGPEIFITDEAELDGANQQAVSAWNALPRALTWTTEPPKVEGNYWWMCEQEQPEVPQMVNVTITDGQFHFFFHYSEGPCLHACDQCRWSGPIPMPQEAK